MYVESFSPSLGLQKISNLRWESVYKYLDVEMGRNSVRDVKGLAKKNMLSDDQKICNFQLTDWQNIDPLNVFVLSRDAYVLCASVVSFSWCRDLDAKLRGLVKKALNLPRSHLGVFCICLMLLGGWV